MDEPFVSIDEPMARRLRQQLQALWSSRPTAILFVTHNRREATVGELAEPFDMSLPAVSKHLKVLERAGLIARGREAQWRPARLQAGPLKDVADWVEHYRRFWEKSLDRLGGSERNRRNGRSSSRAYLTRHVRSCSKP